ncbi:hypothetical protein XFF6990_110062 [Xanthomonas citri pv. fuscans]|uniref:Uncharacterized protein n=1 Tax=Xanthomonas campestris pv. phaseoli TaxID=317013 RepID=A0A7Z7NHT9_XANCH|nr:hypothetical protein XFF6990_110062 [Xanthomonas citri pv. fuscans]SOO23986.1 hypothetical protein XFF6991_310156 [Xanthomonas phaseoli pv. phaseoli]
MFRNGAVSNRRFFGSVKALCVPKTALGSNTPHELPALPPNDPLKAGSVGNSALAVQKVLPACRQAEVAYPVIALVAVDVVYVKLARVNAMHK